VIHEEIMQICKTKTSEDYVVLGKTKNKDSRGLKRHYKGGNFVTKFQDNLHWSKHRERRWNRCFGARKAEPFALGMISCAWSNQAHAPSAWLCTPGALRRFTSEAHAPRGCFVHPMDAALLKSHVFASKARIFNPSSGGNFSYKYLLPHS